MFYALYIYRPKHDQYQTHIALCVMQADNFDAVERVGFCGTHRGLLSDENVFELIKNWLGVPKEVKVRKSKTSKVIDVS